jgi:ABC-type glycerol-3-phosphate transport system substrate-binding protein
MHKIFAAACMCMFLLAATTIMAEPEPEQQQVKLNVWSILPESGKKQLHLQISKDFEKENPNATVIWNFIPQGDMEKKLPTAIAMGEAPDVWSQSYRTVSEFQNHLAPLTNVEAKFMGYGTVEDYQKSWEPGTLDSYSIGKNIYGLPWQYDLYGYIINTEHFIAAGLDPNTDYPKYWDDVIRLGKKLTITEGGRIKRQAVSSPTPIPLFGTS